MQSDVAEIRRRFSALSEIERVELLLELWATLSDETDLTLSDEDKRVIEQRLAEHAANPDDTIPADTAIRRLRERKSG